MSETVLEIVEQPQDTQRDKPLHAWCAICLDRVGDYTPSMCGIKTAAESDPPKPMWGIPENCCVVCADLVVRPCERCGN